MSCVGDNDSLLGDSDGSMKYRGSKPRTNGGQRGGNSNAEAGERNGTFVDDEARTNMELALDSDFDPSLFDWIDESNNSTTNETSSRHESGGDYKVEAGLSLNNDGQGISSSYPANLSDRTADLRWSSAILSSAECPPNMSSTSNPRSSHDGSVQASVLLQNQHGVQSSGAPSGMGQEAAQSTSDANWTNNPALHTLAFNAMAAGANVSSNPTNNNFFLPPKMQQQMVSSQQQAQRGLNGTSSDPTGHPPFLLFDAPIELRANFIASQRAHGLPALEDNNSFHYKQQVNGGFCGVQLVDGRHGNIGNKRVKNEREQKRTQKITDLIDQLRDKMERGGWKVGGAKSKYATLST